MHNKPLAFMAADVNALTSVLQKNISDYPQHLEVDAAAVASDRTLAVMQNDRYAGGLLKKNICKNVAFM